MILIDEVVLAECIAGLMDMDMNKEAGVLLDSVRWTVGDLDKWLDSRGAGTRRNALDALSELANEAQIEGDYFG